MFRRAQTTCRVADVAHSELAWDRGELFMRRRSMPQPVTTDARVIHHCTPFVL